jgi:4-amino-4-deoxy-L-arabinose transferase-like glycosyltransferase
VRAAPPEARGAGASSRPALKPGSPLSRRRFAGAVTLVVLLLAALVFTSLDDAPLVRAEIYFLDAARGMVESGDWLVPRYRGEPFFDKPALTYWLMAFAQLWLGTTAGAARIVPAASSILVLLATVWLGTLLYDRRTALAGGLVLATTFAFVTFGHVAMSDMLLALWSTLAVALAARAVRPGAPVSVWPALGAALGLGFLTKGPIALLLPGIAIGLVFWERRREPNRLPVVPAALGLLLFAVLGLGWFALLYRRLGPDPLAYFFLRENLQRFAGAAYDVGRPAWFYVPTYFAEGVPWSLFAPLAILRGRRDGEGWAGTRLLAAWVLLALVPLSLSRGKIDYYLLPLYPAVSLVVGRFFVAVPWLRLEREWARVVLVLGAFSLLLLTRVGPSFPSGWLPPAWAQTLLVATAAAGAAAGLLAAVRPAPARVLTALAGSAAAVSFVLAAFFLPAFWGGQPNRRIADDVRREQLFRPDATVALCVDPSRAERDILFRARVAVEQTCDLWSLAASREPYLLLVRPEVRRSFRALPGFREVDRYPVLAATALTLAGLREPPRPDEMVLGANYVTADPEAERRARRLYKKMLYLERFHPGLEAQEEAERAVARAPE